MNRGWMFVSRLFWGLLVLWDALPFVLAIVFQGISIAAAVLWTKGLFLILTISRVLDHAPSALYLSSQDTKQLWVGLGIYALLTIIAPLFFFAGWLFYGLWNLSFKRWADPLRNADLHFTNDVFEKSLIPLWKAIRKEGRHFKV